MWRMFFFLNKGAEEGKKYMEKTVNKHHEIVESIKELSNGLLDLEAKLQVKIKTLNQFGHTIEVLSIFWTWHNIC